jgi:hypothetical protein
MKCSMTLGGMALSATEVEKLPDNPVATVAAYLEATYPENRIWITQDEPGDGFATKVWYKADMNGRHPDGEACASITIFED